MSIQDKVLMRKIKKREKQKLKLVQRKEKEKLVEEEQDDECVEQKGAKRVQHEDAGPARSEYLL